jgi:hypothetical protein
MAQDVVFSQEGIEISFSIENEELIVFLTLKQSGQSIEKKLNGEALAKFQAIISRLNYTSFRISNQLDIEKYAGGDALGSAIKQQLITAFGSGYFTSLNKAHFSGGDKLKAEVFIGLPQNDIDIFTIERIQNATGDFMEAMGFELETQDEPVFGSFFQRLLFLLKGEVKQEASELYGKGKIALEAQFIDLPSAEITSKLSAAAAELITALGPVSEAAVRCGSLLIIKMTQEGVSKIIIETTSPELAALLNKSPALLQNPRIVFDLIAGMRAPDRTIEESGSAEIAE